MLIHTVNKSHRNTTALERCLTLASPGSAILLIEDGVYSALENKANKAFFATHTGNYKFYILTEDLIARGISGKILPDFQRVSYEGFVDLCLVSSKVLSWG